MRMLIWIILVVFATGAAADTSALLAARKDTVPSSWVRVAKQPLKMRRITFKEVVDGDLQNVKDRSLAQYKGKFVVLNFWASWCAPCKKEKPHLDALARRLNPKRFAVVSLNYGRDEFLDVQRFYKRYKIRSLGFKRNTTPSSIVKAKPLQLNGIPESFLIDPNGRMVAKVPAIVWTDKRMLRFFDKIEQIYFGP